MSWPSPSNTVVYSVFCDSPMRVWYSYHSFSTGNSRSRHQRLQRLEQSSAEPIYLDADSSIFFFFFTCFILLAYTSCFNSTGWTTTYQQYSQKTFSILESFSFPIFSATLSHPSWLNFARYPDNLPRRSVEVWDKYWTLTIPDASLWDAPRAIFFITR